MTEQKNVNVKLREESKGLRFSFDCQEFCY